jgi:lipopolysaccharide/colanic/teichoic acid biosynthesis glycosyltransferase
VADQRGRPNAAQQSECKLSRGQRRLKRALDLLVGLPSLIVALPFLVAIALAVQLDSPGPAIYRQRRVGELGQLFWMYKFRSMVLGADEQEEDLIQFTTDGQFLFKLPDDPRITRVGRLLRRFSLDELPQMVNVIRGEMSLVGPRPELPWITDYYEPWQWQRVTVPQGVTGWWQVNGRSDKPMHIHTEYDLFYIEHYSLWLDIKILWKTIGAVLRGQGAY